MSLAEDPVHQALVPEHRDPGVGAHEVVDEERQDHQRDQHVLPAPPEDGDVVGDRVAHEQAQHHRGQRDSPPSARAPRGRSGRRRARSSPGTSRRARCRGRPWFRTRSPAGSRAGPRTAAAATARPGTRKAAAKRFSLTGAPQDALNSVHALSQASASLGPQVHELLAVLEVLDGHVDLRVVLDEPRERLGRRPLVRHRVADPLDVLRGVLGLEHELDEQQRGARVLRVHRDREGVASRPGCPPRSSGTCSPPGRRPGCGCSRCRRSRGAGSRRCRWPCS